MDARKQGTRVFYRLAEPEVFDAGYIRGAVSVPLKELKRRLGKLPKRKEIVAY